MNNRLLSDVRFMTLSKTADALNSRYILPLAQHCCFRRDAEENSSSPSYLSITYGDSSHFTECLYIECKMTVF